MSEADDRRSGPGFPPARGHEGYREAAAPASAPKPEEAPAARHPVVTRPEDPETALARASDEDWRQKRGRPVAPPAVRVAVAFVMLLVVLVATVVLVRRIR
jgi:hypothetical protein